MEWVKGYKVEFAKPITRNISCCRNIGDPKIVGSAVHDLLDLGVIELTEPASDQVLSPVFVVPKPDGKFRLILNLKVLNTYLLYRHFKMENVNRARELVLEEYFMASVDMEKAYYSVSVHPESRKYLRFMFEGQLYQYTCLPNGISTAPYVFTKLVKIAFSKLRSMGHVSVVYLDDSLLMGASEVACKENVSDTLQLLQRCGFAISWEKSVLKPTKIIKFLGFTLNSTSMELSLPEEKLERLYRGCVGLLNDPSPSIRHSAKIIGLIVSVLPAFAKGKCYYRELEACKNKALWPSGNFDKKHNLSEGARNNLSWWLSDIQSKVGVPVASLRQFDYEVFSDASLSGYGFCFQKENLAGTWSDSDFKKSKGHINGLEMLAVLKGLQAFSSVFKEKCLLVRSDNVTTVHYINNMGGHGSKTCNDIAIEIWELCFENQTTLEAAFIAGLKNERADALSRLDKNTELTLSVSAFEIIVKCFGSPEIDLFASRNNAKCEKYVSWKPDSNAMAINAFTLDWSKYDLIFAFPPFSLMGRVCQKAFKECSRTMIIVFPQWKSQPWYPRLMEMTSKVKKLPSLPLTENHPMGHHLQLAAGLI